MKKYISNIHVTIFYNPTQKGVVGTG